MEIIKPQKRSLEILLVEDDEVDVMQLTRAFRKKGFTHKLHIARDGVEALDMLRGKFSIRPQIILLDINLPKMSGLELLREIRADVKLKNITVFILSTSSDLQDKNRAYEMNVAGYIVKPVSAEKFSMALDQLNSYWNLIEFPPAV